MSDLVGNPEDRFSHNEAHFVLKMWRLCNSKKHETSLQAFLQCLYDEFALAKDANNHKMFFGFDKILISCFLITPSFSLYVYHIEKTCLRITD